MPNAANAILDPYATLTVTEALMVAVCGMLVVFLMLVILALVIMIVSKLVNTVGGSKGSASAAPAKAAPAPAPAAQAQEAPKARAKKPSIDIMMEDE